jgi:Xaa-Pro aminopeptidase
MAQQPIDSLQNELSKNKLDALLVSNAINIFYLTGFRFDPIEREAFLLISKKENYIFTDGRYSETVSKNIKNFKLIETTPSKKFLHNLKDLSNKSKLKKIGFEEDNLTVSEYTAIKKELKLYPSKNIIEKVRIIKTDFEVLKIKKACKIGDETFKFLLTKIKLGITEIELANALENFVKQKNALLSFDSIVAFGPNSSSPHHKPTNIKLKNNQIVLLDFGINFEGYCSDMTRTVFFGSANEEFKKVYQTVLKAQEKAFNYLESKNILAKADETAREYITSKGYPSIPHSLGHGIGIEVHELPHISPSSHDKAKNNMVFSLEPGIYIPGFGGVRIEDLVVFNNKTQFITHSNRNLIEI